MLHAGQLPGSSWVLPSSLQPQGGQTYCFLSCAAVFRVNAARVMELATTNCLRFIGMSFQYVVDPNLLRLDISMKNLRRLIYAHLRCTDDFCSGSALVWEERR